MTLIITLITLLLLIGAVGLGIRFGMRIGREMAETKVIAYTNRHPLHYAYEVSDTLYPHRAPIILEVPDAEDKKLRDSFPILREHWSLN